MSSMLEQAIIDATELREAALRNAEAAVVEKYSTEVKKTVMKLLEQDEEADLSATEDEPVDITPMEQVPLAHLEEEEEMVVVDLDDIIAAADADSEEDEEEFKLDRSEIADEVGIDLDSEDTAPANRTDELEINEDDLLNMFKEMLVVDLPEVEVERAEEQISQDEKEEDEKIEDVRIDGMNEDDIEEYDRTMAKNESLNKENFRLKKLLTTVKNKLQEISLQNGRLLYVNRVLQNPSLNEQQKNKIVEMISQSRSVDEARMMFETLQKTMADAAPAAPKSLSEVVTRRSSVVLGNRRSEDSATEKSDPTYTRWTTLAGMSDK
jgi:hypothetical protein